MMLSISYNNYVNDSFKQDFKKVKGKNIKDGYTSNDEEDHILGELVSVSTKKYSDAK